MSKSNKYAEIEVASAQKVPTGYTRFAPGDAGFTRAVKKAACEAGRPIYVEYERRYGRDEYRQVATYHAPADVVEQVRQARRVKREVEARKVARRAEERQKSVEERKRAVVCVDLESGIEFSLLTVECQFDPKHADAVAGLTKGQAVTVRGTVGGKGLFERIEVKDCVLAK